MLVLSRRKGETIVIDGCIHVVVMEVIGKRVRLGIRAPATVRVDRGEIQVARKTEPCSENHDIE